jgi:glucose-6-phosphate isomerase
MPMSSLTSLPAWQTLVQQAEKIRLPEKHLSHLLRDSERLARFSIEAVGLFYDFSRQRIDDEAFDLLMKLARERKVKEKFKKMTHGAHLNVTEDRAALHTAARKFSPGPVMDQDRDVMPDIMGIRGDIKKFVDGVHSGAICAQNGAPFKDVVVIGIGGSYLATEFVATALGGLADKGISLHFLSNVDIDNFGDIAARILPETTLWIIISKSYTTTETNANANQAYEYLKQHHLDPRKHVVTVTSKGSPGDDPANPVLATFHMFDFIGGRFSVTSAVGGVPLALYLGYDRFERFLKGAEEMDVHAETAPENRNIPLVAAMLSIWNNNFLDYPACGLIPYCSSLSRLAPHIQQLSMESNGKSVTVDGEPVGVECGTIIFGEPGTNAQHSFFQLAHQGRPFPIDFIGVKKPHHTQYTATHKGVINHQELWANLIAQPQALALGSGHENPARSFPGNRPSSTMVIDDLSPENIGRLLSFYEAKTVFEAFVWDINPFDQFGVELGKVMATDIREQMAEKNKNPGYPFDIPDPIQRYYLEMLMS